MVNSPIQFFYAERRPLPLPEGHRFPASKYPLLLERLAAAGFDGRFVLCTASPASHDQLLLAHTPDYLQRLVLGQMTEREMRRTGFPWSQALVDRSRRSVGATISACRTAIDRGLSANLGGGTHHAFPDHGEGYCVFNDIAVAVKVMQSEKCLQNVIILDCDVHQGNGTAFIFASDPRVFTFSIHGEKNFPFHKSPGDLDIPLPDGCRDAEYLAALEVGLKTVSSSTRAELAIYIAGADPYQDDRLGRMAMTMPGLAQRDRLVFDFCRRSGIPVAVVMGGGYARQIVHTVDIHFQTLMIAVEAFL